MFEKYYAGYSDTDTTDIAVFNSESERDAWISNTILFDRVPYTLLDVVAILCALPDDVEHETDLLDESITWCINPFA